MAQDVTDDTDASLVIDDEGDTVSIYTGCEVDKAASAGAESGTSYIRKINALTGEIIWEKTYECFVVHGVDGGVMGTPVLGKGNLDGLVIFTVARAGESSDTGVIAVSYTHLDVYKRQVLLKKQDCTRQWIYPLKILKAVINAPCRRSL